MNDNTNKPNGHLNGHSHGEVTDLDTEREKRAPKPPKPPKEPLLNLPPVTKILIALIVGLHFILWAIVKTTNGEMIESLVYKFAFIPARFSGAMPSDFWSLFTPITYAFFHGGWFHVLVNSLMLLALGAGFEKSVGPRLTLFVFFVSSIFAAFTHFILGPSSMSPMVGASGGISGLFGALLYIMFLRGQFGTPAMFKKAILVFIAISVAFGFLGGPGGAAIAWAAHIGGFLCGIIIIHMFRKKRL